mmetsp:Transcript_61426/g.92799  ORF Transcript_61426/g.92799 Transcript_61426/m.92799 type:complete len:81 (-) Transcript_61426:72-314(-)
MFKTLITKIKILNMNLCGNHIGLAVETMNGPPKVVQRDTTRDHWLLKCQKENLNFLLSTLKNTLEKIAPVSGKKNYNLNG